MGKPDFNSSVPMIFPRYRHQATEFEMILFANKDSCGKNIAAAKLKLFNFKPHLCVLSAIEGFIQFLALLSTVRYEEKWNSGCANTFKASPEFPMQPAKNIVTPGPQLKAVKARVRMFSLVIYYWKGPYYVK